MAPCRMDPLLKSETYIGAEPNNDVLPNEGKRANLTPTLVGTTPEMQKTALAAEVVMPVHLMNVERPNLLPGPSETPQSKKQKSDSKTKKVTPFPFDSANPPKSLSWVQTDSNEDTWKPFVDDNIVPETQKQEWDVVFSSFSKLKREKKQTGK
ncbi:hypothetical protein MTR67_049357 [Solanum verrucosum]|uniref:Uncharacterized protein n=1 Tax=Solanum verrucosum TaxID=315347 RepID=A0AAF0V098_SOLVR|nr:hypothetical protein MTR67_049357 [Solanum verrucosum]